MCSLDFAARVWQVAVNPPSLIGEGRLGKYTGTSDVPFLRTQKLLAVIYINSCILLAVRSGHLVERLHPIAATPGAWTIFNWCRLDFSNSMLLNSKHRGSSAFKFHFIIIVFKQFVSYQLY